VSDLSREELIAWNQEVLDRMRTLQACDIDEFEILLRFSETLTAEISERVRRDPPWAHTCEGCGEVPAAMRWPPKDTLLCADCWKREWEADRAAEL
jgi:hypothetical protein